MFRNVDADCYVISDGDATYPASHRAAMLKLVLSGWH